MNKISFLITNKFGDVPSGTKNIVILTWDDWNDYSFYTLFGIKYIDLKGNEITLGAIKIGYYGQKKGIDQKKLTIGDAFEKLGEEYFSLGTDDTYYENLNQLGDDELRDEILGALKDIAKDEDIYNKAIKENVTMISLLRDTAKSTLISQYRSIANGGERLTNYSFRYSFPNGRIKTKPDSIDFNVLAEGNPPTNIQIIIGRNGVGKSHLLNGMIGGLLNVSEEKENGVFKFDYNILASTTFSNLICITFSAFDEFNFHKYQSTNEIKYNYIGLKELVNAESIDEFENDNGKHINKFISSLGNILATSKVSRWKKTIQFLESDPIFKDENFIDFIEERKEIDKIKTIEKFKKLSSGHKIVLLTITRLVELLQAKSLVFFDEPESHLHPPLLSSLIRAISELLTSRNAVCIMTTHSPVVLQEVPKSCIWKLRRMGSFAEFERLDLESFGENVGILTNDIFGLEVTDSGFYNVLKELVTKYNSYDEALININNQLGIEGRSILRSLFYDKMRENENNS